MKIHALYVLLLLPAACGGTLPEAAERPVLGHIKSRAEKVTIHSAPGGPRFTVRDGAGRVVAADLSLDELRARHPALSRPFETGYALDASLQLPAEEPAPYR